MQDKFIPKRSKTTREVRRYNGEDLYKTYFHCSAVQCPQQDLADVEHLLEEEAAVSIERDQLLAKEKEMVCPMHVHLPKFHATPKTTEFESKIVWERTVEMNYNQCHFFVVTPASITH